MTTTTARVEREPWIESREGGWFFLSAVLIAPELVVLFPLLAGAIVSFLAPGREPSPFLDTIPYVAYEAMPVIGWLLIVPILATVKAIRLTTSRGPLLALGGFLLLHLSFLGYTVFRWVS